MEVHVKPDYASKDNSNISLRQFPHSDPSYKCLCGLMHVKFATVTIGTISMIGFLISLFWRTRTYFGPKYTALGGAVFVDILLLIAIATNIALFIGLIRQQCTFLLPFIFTQITTMLASIVFLIMVVIFVACDTRYITNALIEGLHFSQNPSLTKAILISSLAMQIFLNVWATRVVCVCYRYFDEFNTFQEHFHFV